MPSYFSFPATGPWHVNYEFNAAFGGWEITNVIAGGPGALAGLQGRDAAHPVGDIIMQVGFSAVFPAVTLDVMVNSAIAAGHRFFIVRDRNSGAFISANF